MRYDRISAAVFIFFITEDDSPAIIFHVVPAPAVMSDIHRGFMPPMLPSSLIPLQINQPFIFGRREGVDLFLNDLSASRRHMELSAHLVRATLQAGQYLQFIVKNLSKTHPVIINDTELKENQQKMLNSSDVIKIGKNIFTVDVNSAKFSKEGQYFLEVRLPQDHQQTPDSGHSGTEAFIEQPAPHHSQSTRLGQFQMSEKGMGYKLYQ